MFRIQYINPRLWRFSLLILVVLLSVTCRAPSNEDESATATATTAVLPFSGRFEVTAATVPVRSGPGLDYETVGSLSQGEIITIDSVTSGGFWLRLAGEEEFWIAAAFVSPIAEDVQPSSTPTGTVTWTTTPMATISASASVQATATIFATPTGCAGPPPGWVQYIIQQGDTLGQIAIATGTTVTALQQANCLTDITIFAGQALYVPRLPPTRTAVPPPTSTPTLIVIPTPSPVPTNFPTATDTPTSIPTATETPTLVPIDTATPTMEVEVTITIPSLVIIPTLTNEAP